MTTSKLNPSDEMLLAQLWIRFKENDEQAFDQLVKMRYRVLFNYATRFTKDREFIKDCIQDLLLELWNRRANVVETPYVTIYLLTALRNNLLRKLRREQGIRVTTDGTLEPETITDGQTTETEWIIGESRTQTEQTLRQAVEQLPKRQQEVVFLKFYEGLSNDDIAQVMDVEKQTVANFIYRAVSQLRAFLPARISSL